MALAADSLFKEMREGLYAYGKTFARKTMPMERMTGRPGLKVRTGALRRTFDVEQSGKTAGTWSMTVYTTSPYARIHEDGGDVSADKGRGPNAKLAIPLPAAQTGAGVARGSPRSFPDTFIARAKSGKKSLLIFQKKGKAIVPLFVLKDKVTIPARLGFEDEWNEGSAERARILESAAEFALDEGGRRG